MAKIITLTFSPTIDKSTTIKELLPEKKMHCALPKIEPGGGGINVARVLKELGENVLAIFPSGGSNGQHLGELLKAKKVPFETMQCKNETRENFAVLDESTNKQYRFGLPSNELFKNEWLECLKLVENQKNVDFIVASGSIPAGVPSNIYAQLSKIAKTNNAKLIIDTSGDALKKAINEGVYLIKPNLEELGLLLGKTNIKVTDIEKVAKEILNKNKCEIIVTSLGAEGAILVTKEKTFIVKPAKVVVKSTVGAGDSMVAGIVFGLSNGETLERSLQIGVACGTAATMNFGSELCKKEDVEMLLKNLK